MAYNFAALIQLPCIIAQDFHDAAVRGDDPNIQYHLKMKYLDKNNTDKVTFTIAYYVFICLTYYPNSLAWSDSVALDMCYGSC